MDDEQVDPSGAITAISNKMDVLLRVSETGIAACRSHTAELAATAVAACCGLCAFTSPRRAEVLDAVRDICCGKSDRLRKSLCRLAVLRRAEQMLPCACATLMLTIAEAHLVPLEQPGQPAAGAQPLLLADCIVLGGNGPQLRILPNSTCCAVFLMLPAAAAYTVALENSRPHALAKKCLLAAVLKMTATCTADQLAGDQAENAMDLAGKALERVLGPSLQLTLHFEQRLQQQQQQQQQHYAGVAAALSNCLAVYDCPLFFALWIDGATLSPGKRSTIGCGISIMQQVQQVMQLHSRNLQQVAEAPFRAGSPWPTICTASGRMALMICLVLNEAVPMRAATQKILVDWIETRQLPIFQHYLTAFRQLCNRNSELSTAQRMSAADGLLAVGACVLAFLPVLEQQVHGVVVGSDLLARSHSFSNQSLLALAMVLQELLQFLAAEDNSQILSVPLPMAFLAQRNGLVAHKLSSGPVSTWRTALALIAQQCSFHTTSAMQKLFMGRISSPMPTQPDMLALLAATAAWPLGAALADVPEAPALWPFMEQCWIAADAILLSLSGVTAAQGPYGRTPWRAAPGALAGCAVALLAFAQCADMIDAKPDHTSVKFSSPMQIAQKAAAWLRANPTAVMTPALPPNDIPEAAALVRLLAWLAEPTTRVALASGVLAEALPALEQRVRSRPPTRQLLAEAGGRWEWAPVAAALHRRLPRRMAARFLPEVDRLTAALAAERDSSLSIDAVAAAAAADAAMASLLLVGHFCSSKQIFLYDTSPDVSETVPEHDELGASVLLPRLARQ